MDMGIAGKWAIVCASSKGLGKGCAMALAEEGVNLVINGRSAGPLRATAKEIRARTGVTVKAVQADVTTQAGRAKLLKARARPDILVNNAGGPPPGDFRDWSRADWIRALDANMLTAIELIKAVVDPMIGRGFGRIVNITSSAVKAPIDVLGLSNGARSGLHGFVAGASRTTVAHNVTINNLLPGAMETDRLRANFTYRSAQTGRSYDEIYEAMRAANPARRFGTAEEFGKACAFLCSQHASFVTGQNFLIDGGAYPGSF